MIAQFLSEFSTEDMNFDFLPNDLQFCLHKNEEAIKAIKGYLV